MNKKIEKQNQNFRINFIVLMIDQNVRSKYVFDVERLDSK